MADNLLGGAKQRKRKPCMPSPKRIDRLFLQMRFPSVVGHSRPWGPADAPSISV